MSENGDNFFVREDNYSLIFPECCFLDNAVRVCVFVWVCVCVCEFDETFNGVLNGCVDEKISE